MSANAAHQLSLRDWLARSLHEWRESNGQRFEPSADVAGCDYGAAHDILREIRLVIGPYITHAAGCTAFMQPAEAPCSCGSDHARRSINPVPDKNATP